MDDDEKNTPTNRQFATQLSWVLSIKMRSRSMIKKIILVATALVFSMSSYAAIDDKEYAKCAIVEGDLARLECFDNLAKKKNLDGRQAQPASIAGKGKWNVFVDVNPIDDSKTVTLSLDSDSGENRWGESVFLIARCKSNTTDLYIGWNDYLGSEADVLTRVGDNKAITQRWSMSTDKKATFHSTPISFLKGMLTSTKMVAQVTPYNESPVTAIFNTSGLENAIIPLRETCNW
jgi:type VI secretion system protein VasI